MKEKEQCARAGCEKLAICHLTQDDKSYCGEHGQEEISNFIGAINSLGGFA